MGEPKPKPKIGRPPAIELRERIRKLYEGGMSQAEIGRKLGMKESAVRYHIRALGIAPQTLSHFPAHPVKGDFKKCAICGEDKPIGEFRNPRHAACRQCRYAEGWDHS